MTPPHEPLTRAQYARLCLAVIARGIDQTEEALLDNANQLELVLDELMAQRAVLEARSAAWFELVPEALEAIRRGELEDEEERRRAMLEGDESPF